MLQRKFHTIRFAVLFGLAWGAVSDGLCGDRLDRGLVALERPDGGVYVGWRLLRSDPSKSSEKRPPRTGSALSLKPTNPLRNLQT